VHDGRRRGSYSERCPAGCDGCGCACGWTFRLAHALDDAHEMAGVPKASELRRPRAI